MKKRFNKKKIFMIIISCILVILGLAFGLFIYLKNKQEKMLIPDIDQSKIDVISSIDLSLNSPIPSIKDFVSEDVEGTIEIYFDNALVEADTLNTVGTYQVKIKIEDLEYEATIQVYDEEPPHLELQELTITEGETYSVKEFVKVCTDNSLEECILEIKEEQVYTQIGTYEIIILAKDKSENQVEEKTTLTINKKINSANPNQNNSITSVTKVDSRKEVSTETQEMNYGIIKTTTITTTYDIYSDGSIKNKKTTSKDSYDYSNYHASTNDLLPEATQNRSTYANQVSEILNYTNVYREEVGVSPLQIDETLTKAAMIRALELSYGNNFSHFRPNGLDCFSVLEDLNYQHFMAGENIANGQKNAQAATTAWRNSFMHYANMTNEGFTKLGVGVMYFNGKYYWVQMFS